MELQLPFLKQWNKLPVLLLILSLLFATSKSWEHEDDDKDLSGCSVEIDGNIYNLKDVSRDTE